MNAITIIYPVLAHVLLVLLLFILLGKRKYSAAKARTVDLKETAMNNKAWPKDVVLVSNNIANQFEVPVLFYVIALVCYLTQNINIVAVTCAWFFVVARYCHAYVHVTQNVVPIRLRFFITSLMSVLVMFVTTMIELLF
jgi:hypothetical protein